MQPLWELDPFGNAFLSIGSYFVNVYLEMATLSFLPSNTKCICTSFSSIFSTLPISPFTNLSLKLTYNITGADIFKPRCLGANIFFQVIMITFIARLETMQGVCMYCLKNS